MATDLPGNVAGRIDGVTAMFLVLPFGWGGSPGEWVPWPWALHQAHGRAAPRDHLWSDRSCFESHFLVDDQVPVEPRLGLRMETSEMVADVNAKEALGHDAINPVKHLLEGLWEQAKICWGLLYTLTPLTRFR